MRSLCKKWGKGFCGQVVELFTLLLIIFMIRTFCFGLYQVPSGSMETTMLVGERFFADKISYWFRNPSRGEIIACNAPTFNYSQNMFKRLFEKFVWGPENWTKRVVGLPGEHVRGTTESGVPVIYVNGKKLYEPYINKFPLVYIWKGDTHVRSNEMINGQHVALKSFDPQKSFDEQPFYRINEDRVIRGQDGSIRMMSPGIVQESSYRGVISEDKNYWDGSDKFNIKLEPNQYWIMGDNRLGSSDSRVFGPVKSETIHGRIVFRIWSIDSDEPWWLLDLIQHPIDFWTRIRWRRFFNIIA